MQDNDFQIEQQWLDLVYEQIDEQLEEQRKQTGDHHGKMQEIRTSLWEDHGISGASSNKMMDVAQQIAELRHSATLFGIQHRLLEQLQAAEKAPYFGRMDFHEEGLPEIETMYVGIRSLVDHKTNLPLIYDWRAPVCGMFYDYGLGEAAYEGPGGIYRGEISLKRQYRIKDRKLLYMFDNELKIDDEVLQQALSKHATEKMRTIVNTIQREQNKAIRNDKDHLLLVEGPAGSGKTSVALHRIAYLLYKYRDVIDSQNIVVFSPNRIFNDYISHVLPELGEENVHQTTFQDFAEPFIGWEWDVQTQLTYLEELLKKESAREQQLTTMAFKSSPHFQTILDNLVDLIVEEACNFSNVKIGNDLVISREEQMTLFKENYSYLPAQKRLQKIRQRIMYLLRPLRKKHLRRLLKDIASLPNFEDESWWTIAREAVKQIKQEVDPIIGELDYNLHIDYLAWYMHLWQDSFLWRKVGANLDFPEGDIGSIRLLEDGAVAYEDIVPLLYLKGELEGYPVKRSIQYVIVDEVQDYAPMQLHILNKTFPRARFTLVGDVHQSLNPYVWQTDSTSLEEIFSDLNASTIRLNKSYRSTEEIFHFCNSLLGEKSKAETVLRNGPKPSIHRVEYDQRIAKLHSLVTSNMENNAETIAVICETAEECQNIYKGLMEYDPKLAVSLLLQEKAKFQAGIIIVPVFLAKGLEFDAVILPDVSDESYCEEYQRRLLYVACSRALHNLSLMTAGPLSPFIQGISSELYSLE